jgi:PKD repeat protein
MDLSSPSRRRLLVGRIAITLAAGALIAAIPSNMSGQGSTTGWKVVAWNNLGMHCMDADYGVFSILPPYNTIQAQVIDPSGQLITSPSVCLVTYHGVADAAGSINTTSSGKTNFWTHILPLFGVSLPVDVGLLNHNMPGPANAPQPMVFDPALNWFIAEGIPLTPYDNTGAKNFYPMMRVTASDPAGAVLATTNIVLPVSDEMSCRSCHASGSGAAAKPAAGWVFDPNPERDYRLNVLRVHDDRHAANPTFAAALAARGYSAAGLYATAAGGKPILCATCHLSEALPGTGYSGVAPLTAAIHTLHAFVADPSNGMTLESSNNRQACYQCHPGSTTKCLRGVMGNAVAADGTMAIQCQNCHGPMSSVGSPARTGWLDEPSCQNCHSGTATRNSGQIRYTSTLNAAGERRLPADLTFATEPNVPAAGRSLYRFSAGHGGLQCSACHGSTHAEYPSSHPNDNVQSIALQGHVGTVGECTACHASSPSTNNGGPHGMHPVGATWVSRHQSAAEGSGRAQCQACHGADYRGTVLSRSFADRTLSTGLGTKVLFRGAQVGCYMCHNGPSSESRNSNRPAVASNLTASTPAGAPVTIHLVATDADANPLTLRIVSQPGNGTVSLSGTTATYFPFDGFSGADSFTYAAWDGSIDSNLATVMVTVTSACALSSTATVPSAAAVGGVVPFSVTVNAQDCAGTITYDWDFGDTSPHATSRNPTHAYSSARTFQWAVTASADGLTTSQTGSIVITSACALSSTATVPLTAAVGASVPFSTTVTAQGCAGTIAYDWNFGDGSPHATNRNPTHAYSSSGTFQWAMAAAVDGRATTQTGSITVSPASQPGPAVTGVRQLSDPFGIRIDGANFVNGVTVLIGADTVPWRRVQLTGTTRLTLSGDGLSAKFPRRLAVTIRIVNPDGQSVTTSFTRQ